MTDLPYEIVPEEHGRFETVGASQGYYLLGDDEIQQPSWVTPESRAAILTSKLYRGAFDDDQDTEIHSHYMGKLMEPLGFRILREGVTPVFGFSDKRAGIVAPKVGPLNVDPWARWPSGEQQQIRSKANPRVGATPDAIIRGGEFDGWLLEFKTWAYRRAEDWKQGPPIHIQLQVQQQMYVTGIDHAIFAVLFGCRGPVHCFQMHKHERSQQLLVTRINQFWTRVEEARREAEAA